MIIFQIIFQQKTRIDDTLVKFFYGCNIPFKLVESKLFLNFLNAIRPAYTPPFVEAMSNNILHGSSCRTWETSTFFNSNGILVITRTEIKQILHVIGFVQSEEKIIYLKTWDIQEGHNSSLMINEAITLANMKFNSMIIYAVITDEDIRLLNTDEYNKQWILQCNISLATSIEKELVDLEFTGKVCYLLEQFSRKELQKDLITRGGVAFLLEGNSSCYNCDLFSTCLKNLRAMT